MVLGMYLINCMGYIHGPFWSLIIGPHLLLFYRQGDILLNKYFFHSTSEEYNKVKET